MSNFRRRLMMSLKNKEYTKLAYIESTGEQYIDTEYVFKNKPKVVGKIMITNNADADIMGTPIVKAGCFIIDFNNGGLYYRYSSTSSTQMNTGIQIGNWYNMEFSNKVIVDGVEKGTISSYDFSSNTQSFLIGKGRNYGNARYKEIKMYDGDELVRDLVPCYSESKDEAGMIDIINRKFYPSMTDIDFIHPPYKDMELQYIETTGTQYIDTGYVFKNKPKVVGDIMVTLSNDRDIMGTPLNIPGCFIIDFFGAGLYYRYSSTSSTQMNTGIQIGNWYNMEFSNKVIVDGVEKGTISSYDFSSNTQSFLIGKGRNYGNARYKEIKMYDGDELVRDLVPYYKKDVEEVGMLDKVHNVFYENQGSGEFLYE